MRHHFTAGRILALAAFAAISALIGAGVTVPAAAATTDAYVLSDQGICNGWGNVILSGRAYAPGVPAAPPVYGNLYRGSCANSHIEYTSAYGYEHQCTEFAVHWAAAVWHVAPGRWKSGGEFVDAYQMWGQAAGIAGLSRIANGHGTPRPGDLMVFEDDSVGHVAVVVGVHGRSLYFVGQNQGLAEQHIAMANSTTVSATVASRWLGVSSGGSVVGWVRGPSPVVPLHTAIALIPHDGASGYTVDGYGTIRPFGNAPAVTTRIASWPAWDIARGIAVNPGSTSRRATGFVVDGWGGIHPFGAGGATPPPTPTDNAYWHGWDIARAIVLSRRNAGYVLDGWGGIHPFAAGHATPPPIPKVKAYWPGWDIARAMALTTPRSGYVLDGWGGIHPFGPDAAQTPAAPRTTAYWSGWDIARGIAMLTRTNGLVLDGYGGTHGFAVPGTAMPTPPLPAPGYDAGNDVFRGIAADRSSGQVGEVRAFESDGSGGTVYRFSL